MSRKGVWRLGLLIARAAVFIAFGGIGLVRNSIRNWNDYGAETGRHITIEEMIEAAFHVLSDSYRGQRCYTWDFNDDDPKTCWIRYKSARDLLAGEPGCCGKDYPPDSPPLGPYYYLSYVLLRLGGAWAGASA